MKLIIAGSRTIKACPAFIFGLFNQFHIEPEEIVSGGAGGVDKSGEYAAKISLRKVKIFKADWDKYGKSAGPIRNKQMAEYADKLLLIWDGQSKGSKNMKEQMLKLNKPIYEIILPMKERL